MKNTSFVILITLLIFNSCGISEQRKAEIQKQEREKHLKDSLELVKRKLLERDKAIKDSIIAVEEKIAISSIYFGISEKEFKRKKNEFLNKCRLPKYEFYKNLTIIDYKIGEYGFNQIYGWFYKDSLYSIRLNGPIVNYDEYNRIMPDQYKALTDLLKQKYGEPAMSYGLPRWNEIEKGYFRRCDIWEIGTKKIEVQILCEGVNYYLNLEVFKPEIERKLQLEKEQKDKKSTEKGVDLL